jgi:hypothetical protein
VERFIPPGSHILELNAGTGTDAVQLAARLFVHALTSRRHVDACDKVQA